MLHQTSHLPRVKAAVLMCKPVCCHGPGRSWPQHFGVSQLFAVPQGPGGRVGELEQHARISHPENTYRTCGAAPEPGKRNPNHRSRAGRLGAAQVGSPAQPSLPGVPAHGLFSGGSGVWARRDPQRSRPSIVTCMCISRKLLSVPLYL